MVMFTCNRCSAALKKSQVQNHAFKCGGQYNINLTCHDCLKDFRGNEYESHTSCVSEEARYGGKGAVVKEAGKKQNQWCEVVQNVLQNNKALDRDVHKFLKNAALLQNIPRKRPQFVNWANNAMKGYNMDIVNRVFDLLTAEFNQTKSSEQSKNQTKSHKKDQSDQSKPQGKSEIANKGAASNEDDSSRLRTDEINDNGTNSDNPRKKKKNKKHASNDKTEDMEVEKHETTNGTSPIGVGEISENGELPKKKKKNKKSIVVTEESSHGDADEPITEDITPNGIHENGEVRKNKKKGKKSADVSTEEPMEGLEESTVAQSHEPTEIIQPGTDNGNQANTQKLSKKERKLLKKKAKFDAEVAEIESAKKEEGEEEIVEEEKPKKSKKRKNEVMKDSESTDDGAKKRKVETGEVGTKGETEPTAEEDSPKKVKFNWHENILAVLRKSKNDELPVKKVSKRVLDEYVTQYGDKGIHEKLHAKMNKKLQTCPGVRVLKDKVKLLESDR